MEQSNEENQTTLFIIISTLSWVNIEHHNLIVRGRGIVYLNTNKLEQRRR